LLSEGDISTDLLSPETKHTLGQIVNFKCLIPAAQDEIALQAQHPIKV
jgi:hypothetical protein